MEGGRPSPCTAPSLIKLGQKPDGKDRREKIKLSLVDGCDADNVTTDYGCA